MAAMQIPKAVVAGQSPGGTVALEFALTFPERPAGLVLIDAGGHPIAWWSTERSFVVVKTDTAPIRYRLCWLPQAGRTCSRL